MQDHDGFYEMAKAYPVLARIVVVTFSVAMGALAGLIAWSMTAAVVVFIFFYLDEIRELRERTK
jgi:hypothetical protein